MKITDIAKGDFYRTRIADLEDTCSEQEKEIEKLKNEIQSLKNRNTQLSDTIQEQITTLKSMAALYDFQKAKVPAHFEKLQEQWAHWDLRIHSQPYQLERQIRSCQKNYTPLELHPENSSAYFRGINEDYWTTLAKCTCQDFQRRQLPCKHMYRLAYEFDVFMPEFEVLEHPNPKQIMHLHSFKNIINHLSPNLLNLYENLKCEPAIVCDRFSAQKLVDKGIASFCEDKRLLLSAYKKEELLSLLSDYAAPSTKRLKKDELIDSIINDHPEIIDQVERLTVSICLSENVRHLVYYPSLL